MINEALRGKRIAITGTTGFVGTALVERLLRQIDDVELVLLVRPGRRGAQTRVDREILRNDAFDRLRERWGDDFSDECSKRVHAVAADVTKEDLGLDDVGRELLLTSDIIIHSAASVAFDNPIDVAVETNLVGPVRLMETLRDNATVTSHVPHFVAVSTAYVAGTRKGDAPEHFLTVSPFAVDVNWRVEIDAARRARTRIEDESRSSSRLAQFRKEADVELGAAGLAALADRTEQQRNRWVKEQLVELGIARATSLGFPDAYAFTKAMAEEAVAEVRGEIPLSIVRPSIIESALAEPFPGWIRGFRMAEPVILGFGRGLLRDFPGTPEGALDVIPVDLVVAAIIGVAARGPEPEPSIVQVASSDVNRFTINQLLDWGTQWFTDNPLYDERDQPIPPPRWTYPSRDRVQKQLGRLTKGLLSAEAVMRALPVRGRKAMIAAELEDRRSTIENALSYVELYGKYVECEATYRVDRLLTLWDTLPPEDQADFNFDPRSVDWEYYLTEVHLPSVIKLARAKTAPSGRTPTSRSDRLRKQVLAPERQLAAFDLENTLIASNVVGSWGWLATNRLEPAERVRLVAKALVEGPGLLALDRRDRSDFLRHFYRRYRGAPVDQIEADAQELFSDLLLANSFPAAIRRVRQHRALGHRTVLITGALDFVTAPLAPLFDDIIAAEMGIVDGRYTGNMTNTPPTGENRAQALRDYVATHGLDLGEAVAYADSTSDLPMLEAVGFPVAVNPETKLATLANRRGWLIEQFDPAEGSTNKMLPVAPLRRSRKVIA